MYTIPYINYSPHSCHPSCCITLYLAPKYVRMAHKVVQHHRIPQGPIAIYNRTNAVYFSCIKKCEVIVFF